MSEAARLDRTAELNLGKRWHRMSTAPHNGLILLKCPINGGNWPMIGKWNSVHGYFCTPPLLGLNETPLLGPMAWTEIPAYDEA